MSELQPATVQHPLRLLTVLVAASVLAGCGATATSSAHHARETGSTVVARPCAGSHETPTSEDVSRAVLGIQAQAQAGVSADQLSSFDITKLANKYGLCYAFTHQVNNGSTLGLDVYFLPEDLAANVGTVENFMKASSLFTSVQLVGSGQNG